MKCKFCGASMEDGQTVCPVCGADNAAEPREEIPAQGAQTPEPVTADSAEGPAEEQTAQEGGEAAGETDRTEAAGEAENAETAEETQSAQADAPDAETETISVENAAKKPASEKLGKGFLVVLVAVALVAVAAIVILLVRNGKDSQKAASGDAGETSVSEEAGTSEDDPLDVAQVDASGAYLAHDYLVADTDVTEDMANQVVAASGDMKLTNAMLSYYYWQQYYNVLSSYMGSMLDTSKSMADQMYDETHSWQDMLLRSALATFRQQAAACNAANAAGFQLEDKYTSYLDSLQDGMESEAQSNGFDSADAYLQSLYGPYASTDTYLEYAHNTFLGADYLQSLYSAVDCTEDDVSAYYDANADTYAASGITKDDTLMVNVRHILIKPVADDNAETDSNGSAVLTDQNWADAEAKANEIYAAWKAGDATEDSFAEMAKESSEDPGSASDGGLYENVYPGEMETAFNDWCFESGRQSGDTGIVKTSYGYHIMYFSGFGDTSYWYSKAQSDYLDNQQTQITKDMVDASAFTVDHSKVVLMESSLIEPADQSGQTDGAAETEQAETDQTTDQD